MRYLSLHLVLALSVAFLPVGSYSQQNLIINGDFSSDSGWNDLANYEQGEATGTIENGSYKIDITSPGIQSWSIQFTQSHIALDSGKAYTFSYRVASSIKRTIEVSLSRNGGDYASYSGRDTISIGPTPQFFKDTFEMTFQTDADTRLEFNCGKDGGIITISDVQLVEFTESVLSLKNPYAGEIVYQGVPYTLAWKSIGVKGSLVVQFSPDNSDSWVTLDTIVQDSGSYTWIPGNDFSPWCRLRIVSTSDQKIYSVNEGPFELAPRYNLIADGTFSLDRDSWEFNTYNGTATGEVTTDGAYHITIDTSADEPWQIQLKQNRLNLNKGVTYELSLTAWASDPTSFQVIIGQDEGPYLPYTDTSEWIVAVTTKKKQYHFLFTMSDTSDSNARIEINCGRAEAELFIDDISLTTQYHAPTVSFRKNGQLSRPEFIPRILYTGASSSSRYYRNRSSSAPSLKVFDLMGRTVHTRYSPGRNAAETRRRSDRLPPGIYLVKNNRGR